MANKLFVPPDFDASLATLIDIDTGTIESQMVYPSTEVAIKIPASGVSLASEQDASQDIVGWHGYDANRTLIFSDVSLVIPDIDFLSPIGHNRVDKFYVFRLSFAGGTADVRVIDSTGVVQPENWTLDPTNATTATCGGVDPTNQILYFGHGTTLQARIFRVDLNTGLPLSDLYLGAALERLGRDLYVLSDASVLVAWRATALSNAWSIRQLSSAGAVVQTIAIGDSLASGSTPPRIVIEDDETHVWAMSFPIAGLRTSRFQRFSLTTGLLVQTFDLPNFAPPGGFRADNTGQLSQSCPVLFYGELTPDCPGEISGTRTDGLAYNPVVPQPCAGSGTRSGSRTGQ